VPPDLEHVLIETGKCFQDKRAVVPSPIFHARRLTARTVERTMTERGVPLLVVPARLSQGA